jgi:hypothetical protein
VPLPAVGCGSQCLAHVGAVHCVAVRRHIIDAQCDEIASAQFAIDRQIEEGQVAYTQLKVAQGATWPEWTRHAPVAVAALARLSCPCSMVTVSCPCSAMIEGWSPSRGVISSFERPPRLRR